MCICGTSCIKNLQWSRLDSFINFYKLKTIFYLRSRHRMDLQIRLQMTALKRLLKKLTNNFNYIVSIIGDCFNYWNKITKYLKALSIKLWTVRSVLILNARLTKIFQINICFVCKLIFLKLLTHLISNIFNSPALAELPPNPPPYGLWPYPPGRMI